MEDDGKATVVVLVPPRGKEETERIRDICFDALSGSLSSPLAVINGEPVDKEPPE